jgi:hypothetical protein
MSIQINVGDHVSPQAGYLAVPLHLRDVTRWARTRAQTISRGMPGADVYFRTLPGGRSLTALLADRTIWINYGPGLGGYGETDVAGGREMAISTTAYRLGRWTVLATLIHELAHVNGVQGRLTPQAAEDALLSCGLGRRSERTSGVDDARTPFDPTIGG